MVATGLRPVEPYLPWLTGMLNRLLGNAAIYAGSNVLGRAVAFLLLPLYARVLAPSELGIIELVVAIGAVLNLLLPLEISVAFGRFAADARLLPAEHGRLVTTSWSSLFLTSTIGFLVLATLPIQSWMPAESRHLFVSLGQLPLCLWSLVIINSMLANQLRWRERAKAFGGLAFLTAASTLVVGYWLVLCERWGVRGALTATCFGLLLACIAGGWMIRGDFSRLPSLMLWRRMMAFALPLWLGNVLLVLAQQADRFLLATWLGLDELGHYSIALRFASIAAIAVGGVQMALVPVIFSNAASMRPLLGRMLALYSLGAAVLVSSLAALSQEIVAFVASPRFADVAPLIPVLTLGSLLHGAYVFFPGLWLENRTRQIAAISAAYAAAVIIFSALGTTLGGLAGLALGQIAASAVFVVLTARSSKRFYPYAQHPRTVALAIGCATVATGVAFTNATLCGRFTLLLAIVAILFFAALRHAGARNSALPENASVTNG